VNEIMNEKRQCTDKRNIKESSRNRYCRGQAISITYSECVSVALGIQHARCLSRIILSFVTWSALPYFSTYLTKGRDFIEKGY
jgi:hypothetical protein